MRSELASRRGAEIQYRAKLATLEARIQELNNLRQSAKEEIAKREPYAKRIDVHRTTQNEDGIFRGQHGSSCMLNLERIEKRSNAGGFVATIALAVDPEATPATVGGGRGRRGGE